MKFRTYKSINSDSQLFVTINNDIKTEIQNEFEFRGFSNGIHPYNRKRINRVVDILKTKGIILNVAEVSTTHKMFVNDNIDDINDVDKMLIPKGFDKISEDGNVYILFQDTEMGRGWSFFIKNKEVLRHGHRSDILDELEDGDFIRSFGIDYKIEYVDDLNNIKIN